MEKLNNLPMVTLLAYGRAESKTQDSLTLEPGHLHPESHHLLRGCFLVIFLFVKAIPTLQRIMP